MAIAARTRGSVRTTAPEQVNLRARVEKRGNDLARANAGSDHLARVASHDLRERLLKAARCEQLLALLFPGHVEADTN